ncbi:hypothetical protein F4861DRAFT_17667 [Xylaria intraflava]|nr:hypothetical protein F4861DRAFT_17667 [Xylaria intraflava]
MQFTTFAVAALSMGSAIAQPLTGLVGFTDVTAAVSQARTLVQTEVTTIQTLAQGDINNITISKIQQSLLNVGQTVNGLVKPVVSLAGVNTTPLTQGQITAVPALLQDVQKIVVGTQTIAKSVASGQQKDSLSQVQSELQFVLGPVSLIGNNVVSFATAAVPATSTVFVQVQSLLGGLQPLLAGLLAPVTAILGQILGGTQLLGGL